MKRLGVFFGFSVFKLCYVLFSGHRNPPGHKGRVLRVLKINLSREWHGRLGRVGRLRTSDALLKITQSMTAPVICSSALA